MKARLREELRTLEKAYLSGEGKKVRTRRSLEEKRALVEEAKKLLLSYKTVLLIDSTNLPSSYVSELRKRLEGIGVVKVFKNNLLKLAMKELEMKNWEEFAKYLQGTNIMVFVNLNPFEAKRVLDSIKVWWRVKPGEKVDNEIIITPMKTNIKPGPAMSVFGKLKIPVQVRDGVLWIAKESTLLRPGLEVTPELVSILNNLGIAPKILRPVIKVAYEAGVVIPGSNLALDIEAFRKEFIEATQSAIALASELVVPEPMVLRISVAKAYTRAQRLAAEAGIVTKETAPIVISLALARAYAIASILAMKSPELAQGLQISISAPAPAQQQQQQAAPKAEEKKEEEKKEGVSEEQLAEGLSALFG
ncbi:MAG: 50S ribosomal protein L10 [Ignisphaera sp.]|nr:50S ribosomal protein L10 [Ignisphaera sp.]